MRVILQRVSRASVRVENKTVGAIEETGYLALVGLRDTGLRVETGVFGADMQVELVNDGPVTLILDSETL